ncbi:PWWP domain-containing protein 2A isoform X4 [Pteronotus mesoamericanus]|uniref:PWWP domain-containing protein 2A isoform X4 n=1 Tax=Pteronotus mesoamericanus TaxID=1884717 RepID=UPI0023EDB021|nr:PWWP domain-containing protein 2A isoform X4 [Pteronotus parnellii mesoamericanus]
MAAVAAEAAATAASPGEGGAGEAEPEMEPIPGTEAGTDTLPVTATEASVPDGEADGKQSSPQADEPLLSPPRELARSPEAAGPELEAEEKLPARAVEPAVASPQEGPDLPPSPAPPPEQPPAPEERQEPPLPQPATPALVPPAGGDSAVSQLIPGSEVRVTLDHIIEDALVVSFRLGEKLFSGVLMDLSKSTKTLAGCWFRGPVPQWHRGPPSTRIE